jgi:hypothetical protein
VRGKVAEMKFLKFPYGISDFSNKIAYIAALPGEEVIANALDWIREIGVGER